MRVQTILQDFVGKKLASSGLRRTKINAVMDMTLALLSKSYLTVTSLGEHFHGTAKVRHKIKRVDRWLGNDGLYESLASGYKAILGGGYHATHLRARGGCMSSAQLLVCQLQDMERVRVSVKNR
jgi:hypothetical protein